MQARIEDKIANLDEHANKFGDEYKVDIKWCWSIFEKKTLLGIFMKTRFSSKKLKDMKM